MAAAFTASAATAKPIAHSSVSKRYTRHLLRRVIRQNDPGLVSGSIIISDCRKGYTRDGWPRVYCHAISWDRRRNGRFHTVCAWGKVVEKQTYFSTRVYPQRYC